MTIKPASFIFFLLLTASLMAGVGGKLSGEILSDGGTALADVNVIIRGTDLGTAADSDGHYYILNIPPGSYDVQYSSIGYKTLIIEEISIQSDFTTLVDVELVQSFLESEEVVTVTAERPLIQKDATSKVVVVTAEEMINMPVENFKDVLATRAGFTTDA
ncbi:MAG: carboxypeptidase-like regulatory domain-containing protein, partial [FCB group bacterium]|nr:carboxypeptidase-like regulatory domain-containing protein [FCB group bacterium]